MKIVKRIFVFLFAAALGIILLPAVFAVVMITWTFGFPVLVLNYVPKKELAKLDDEYL